MEWRSAAWLRAALPRWPLFLHQTEAVDQIDRDLLLGPKPAGFFCVARRQLNEAHRQFIADASHQLKTPLTTLKTQAALALRQTDAGASRAIVQEIHDSTDATSRVIQQLLSLARSQPGHMLSSECVDLAELARETALELITPALAKSIDLGFEGEDRVLVTGNRVLLHEIVSNLVDNAIRYTPDGGRITVSVRSGVAGASLIVDDNGPGIPEPERANVFKRFYRIPATHSNGCGLCLPIVKQICDRHGALMELGEADGGGLRVRVQFPAPQPG